MAQNDDDLDLDVEATPAKAGGGGWKKIALFAGGGVLLVAISVMATILVLHTTGAAQQVAATAKSKPTPKKVAAPAPANTGQAQQGKGTPNYLDLNPPFVVNLNDNSGIRFLQVGVSVMTYDKQNLQLVKNNMPVVRNSLMLLFSSQKFADIKTREGKLKLQHEALQVVQKALANITGKPVIDKLYLSSLVGQ